MELREVCLDLQDLPSCWERRFPDISQQAVNPVCGQRQEAKALQEGERRWVQDSSRRWVLSQTSREEAHEGGWPWGKTEGRNTRSKGRATA